ncbi:MAG: TonB-dependent receptor [Rhizomicrobium sp.]
MATMKACAIAALAIQFAWAATPAAADSGAIETVVVTAEKRSEDIQKVAGTISAYSADQLQALQIHSTEDLALHEPGLDYYAVNGSSFVTLRGVGVPIDTGTADNNIAFNVDGVNIPRATEGGLSSYDLERVEVLRGPQGTLYGRNTTGGAINYISAAPTEQFQAEAGALGGNYATWGVHGYVSGAVADGVRLRLSVAHTERDEGYVRNVFTGGSFDKLDNSSVRLSASVDFTPELRGDFAVQYMYEDFQSYQQIIGAFPGNPYPFGVLGDLRYLGTPVYPGTTALVAERDYSTRPWTIASDFNPDSHRSTFLATSNLNWDLGNDISLRSTTGFIDHQFFNGLDGDSTSVPIDVIESSGPDARKQPSRSFSQEFNLLGRLGQNGSWLLGAYYFSENDDFIIPVLVVSNISPVFNPGTDLYSATRVGERSYALFADATVSLTDQLRVFGGVRISWDQVHTQFRDAITNPGGIFTPAVVPPAFNPTEVTCFATPYVGTLPAFKQSWNPASPRVGLQYDVADNVNVYVQYQRGFKDGGGGLSNCGNLFDPENLDSYEAGVKSTLMDGHLTLNASGYFYRYKGMQIFKIIAGSSSVENADVEIRGLDLDARLKPIDHLTLDAAATLLDTKFTKFCSDDPLNPAPSLCPDGTAGYDLKGRPIPNAPSYSVNAAAQWDQPVDFGPFAALSLRAEARFVGETHITPYGPPGPVQRPYTLVSAFGVLYAEGQDLQVRVYGRNLTNEAVIAHYVWGSEGAVNGTYLPPRTFGIEITKGFH